VTAIALSKPAILRIPTIAVVKLCIAVAYVVTSTWIGALLAASVDTPNAGSTLVRHWYRHRDRNLRSDWVVLNSGG
jgi:hypothetical protein